MGSLMSIINAGSVFLNSGVLTDEDGKGLFAWLDRIFGLDAQMLADVCITLIAVFVLFLLLSYLLFNPARELLEKRRAKIQADLDAAAKDKEDALLFKAEYDAKVLAADKEVDEILSGGSCKDNTESKQRDRA